MRKKGSLLNSQLFDKKRRSKSRRVKRRESSDKMLNAKASAQRREAQGHTSAGRSQLKAVAELRRMDRVIREMRAFEKVSTRERQNLKHA